MVILYSTNCPKCIQLEKRLKSSNIPFEVCHNVEVMLSLGIMSAPMLNVDGTLLDFAQAWKWVQVNGQTNN